MTGKLDREAASGPPHDGGATESAPRGRSQGRATRRLHPEEPCLNCGDTTAGEFCANCGQRKAEVLVSVRAMVSDVLEDEFVLNRRLPMTLFYLFFRPGYLTEEHLNGRIVRYIRPFRLYLLSSVVFFLLLSFFSLRAISRAQFDVPRSGEVSDSVALAEAEAGIAAIDSALAEAAPRAPERIGLGPARAALESQRQRALAGGGAEGAEATVDETPTRATGRERTLREMIISDSSAAISNIQFGSPGLQEGVRRRVEMIMDMTPRQAAERMVGDFLNYIPTMMFLLLPFFALVLKVLYIRKDRYYVEHFVFLLHAHAFIYLLFTVMLLLRGSPVLRFWVIFGLMIWAGIYLLMAMKRVYRQGWVMTFVKGWTLGWTYLIVLTVSVPVALVVSVLLL